MRILNSFNLILAASFVATTVAGKESPKKLLSQDVNKSRAYAIKYCKKGNDCPDGQYERGLTVSPPFYTTSTDCTHFIAHVLDAGGVTIPGSSKDASCANGLIRRVRELAAWFDAATTTYANVRKLKDWTEAKANDIVILRDSSLQPYHVAMLNGNCKADGAQVFGHEADRCGDEFVKFAVGDAFFYRIEAGPFDGKWKSTDSQGRFRLELSGVDVVWIEHRADGKELRRTATMVPMGDSYQVSRVNDDEVLKFLDFPDASLRKAIINAGPEPSTMLLSMKAGKLEAEWRGLAVKKKANDTFNGLIQPTQATPKRFTFNK